MNDAAAGAAFVVEQVLLYDASLLIIGRKRVVAAEFLINESLYPDINRSHRGTAIAKEADAVCYLFADALREEGDVRNCSAAARSAGYFYPRPPRGGRRFVLSSRSISVIFLSTPSARRATLYNRSQQNGYSISIHALREEGDERNTGDYRLGGGHFYPRPPRGGRRQRASKSRQRASISIHALREEGDLRYGKPARAI